MTSIDKHRIPGSIDKHLPDFRGASSTVDDLDIAGNDFVAQGDFVPRLTFGGLDGNASTTSSTYGNVLTGNFDPRLTWDNLPIPSGATTGALLMGSVDPSTDQIDVRVRNINANETAFEKTGITGSEQPIGGTAQSYTPSDTDIFRGYRIQIRNNDGTTSVEIDDPTVVIGVIL